MHNAELFCNNLLTIRGNRVVLWGEKEFKELRYCRCRLSKLLKPYVIFSFLLDVFVARGESYLLDVALDVLFIAHWADEQCILRVDDDVVLESVYHCHLLLG